jgi:hypothetical protein
MVLTSPLGSALRPPWEVHWHEAFETLFREDELIGSCLQLVVSCNCTVIPPAKIAGYPPAGCWRPHAARRASRARAKIRNNIRFPQCVRDGKP